MPILLTLLHSPLACASARAFTVSKQSIGAVKIHALIGTPNSLTVSVIALTPVHYTYMLTFFIWILFVIHAALPQAT